MVLLAVMGLWRPCRERDSELLPHIHDCLAAFCLKRIFSAIDKVWTYQKDILKTAINASFGLIKFTRTPL